MKRCMQCMKEYGDSSETCIHCGYKPGSSEREHYYLPEGTTLGDRYIVGKVLGHGGFGITYIGFDQKLMLRIAIKEYLPAEISTRALGETTVTTFSGDKHDAFVYGLGRFIDEAKTMAQFETNPCIVSVKDFFEANDTAYLVMEYLDGITLGEYLKRSGGRISEEETRSIIRPVIDALQEVHAKGIIHRDISPDNIFILGNSPGEAARFWRGTPCDERKKQKPFGGIEARVCTAGAVLYARKTGAVDRRVCAGCDDVSNAEGREPAGGDGADGG